MNTFSKSELRHRCLESRQYHDSRSSSFYGQQLVKFFKQWPAPRSILLYSSIHGEISTDPLFEFFSHRAAVYFPRVVGKDIEFRRVETLAELIPAKLCPEPAADSELWDARQGDTMAVIPAVAFSTDGQRIGYGGGFYDRFLSRHPQILRVGIAYSEQIKSAWAAEAHDIAMDFIVSPGALWGSKHRICR